jgi:hypothetical protein
MDGFARLPGQERRLYFEQTGARLGMAAPLIEKDFWVCWTLRRLFSLDEFGDHLTFKGGTTLSKVYHVIERFSEDVDVAIERGFLGFGGANEPEEGPTGKQQQGRVVRLAEVCRVAVKDRLLPQLRQTVASALGGDVAHTLTLDPADPDQQAVRFQYPLAITGKLSPYFTASVKIEFGARSDHFPVEDAVVKPYLWDVFPQAFSVPETSVRVLAAARTFWEKVTILHMLHHLPENKKVTPRMSRHYYDVFRLSQGPIWEQALASINLLERVAAFKSVFFKAAWAKYEEARCGTLRLVPAKHTIGVLLRDYEEMQPMFFRDPPTFEVILEHLARIERKINSIDR